MNLAGVEMATELYFAKPTPSMTDRRKSARKVIFTFTGLTSLAKSGRNLVRQLLTPIVRTEKSRPKPRAQDALGK